MEAPEEANDAEPALATVNFPVPIESLPLNLAPNAIAPASFLGNWHKHSISDHIWTAGGVSALSFKFKNPQKRVEVALRGRPGPGVGQEAVHFRAFGPSKTSLLPVLENKITFLLEDEKPFESALIIIEVKTPVKIEGDARELGFVLFGVDLA